MTGPGTLTAHPCVIPVAAADALAWLRGALNDSDLLLRSPLRPEAVFVVYLPCGKAAFRECVRLIRYWRARGAVCLVTRLVEGGDMARHLWNCGGEGVLFEDTDPPKRRWIVPPDQFAKWCPTRAGSPKTLAPVPL